MRIVVQGEHVTRIVELLSERSRLPDERVRAGQAAVVGPRYRPADGRADLVAARGLHVPVGTAS